MMVANFLNISTTKRAVVYNFISHFPTYHLLSLLVYVHDIIWENTNNQELYLSILSLYPQSFEVVKESILYVFELILLLSVLCIGQEFHLLKRRDFPT